VAAFSIFSDPSRNERYEKPLLQIRCEDEP